MNNYTDTMGGITVVPALWEQRRYEIAKAIMAAAYVTYDNRGITFDGMAYDAVRAADALIKELRGSSSEIPNNCDKEGGNDE